MTKIRQAIWSTQFYSMKYGTFNISLRLNMRIDILREGTKSNGLDKRLNTHLFKQTIQSTS